MADPAGWKTVDAAPWAEIVLNDPVTTLFKKCVDLEQVPGGLDCGDTRS